MKFIDALLADLQGTAGVTSFDANEKVNGHESNGKESPSAGKPFSYSPIPPRKPETSVLELDNLLDDLNEKSKS